MFVDTFIYLLKLMVIFLLTVLPFAQLGNEQFVSQLSESQSL